MKKEKSFIEKITNARTILLFIITAGAAAGMVVAGGKKAVEFWAKDSIKKAVDSSKIEIMTEVNKMMEENKQNTENQFANLIDIMSRSNQNFKEAAEEKLKEDQNNQTIIKALKK